MPDTPPPSSSSNALRVIAAIVIVTIIAAAVFEAIHNPWINSFVRHPQHHGAEVREWSARHPLAAPFGFFGLFFLLGAFALPVWWLQIVAGITFGMTRGLVIGLLTGAITSVAAAMLSRFVFGELLRAKLTSHTERLTRLDESLNHNGLLVVCGVRLLHFIPAGLSNYAFGLTKITMRDIAVGSILGGLPSTCSLVAIGARPDLLHRPWFVAVLIALNLSTIALLAVRYMRPQWFRRYGLE